MQVLESELRVSIVVGNKPTAAPAGEPQAIRVVGAPGCVAEATAKILKLVENAL
jgi:hypothetical protein